MNGVFRTVLSMSLSGSLLVLLLLLLRPLLRHRLSQRWWYYVWLIVIARLLLPLTPPASLMGALFSPTEVSPPAVFGEMTPGHTVPAGSGMDSGAIISAEDDTATLNTAPSHIALPKLLRQNIGLAWLMGSLLLLLRRATEYQSFRRFLRAAGRPVDNPALLDRLALLGESMGVRRPVDLWESAAISTPLLLGISRPCIVLPHLNLSEEDFRYTVCHELVHCRRRDVITKWLGQLTLCVHWFNPLIWQMVREMDRSCELSCDEAVTASLSAAECRAYGDTLLRAAGQAGRVPAASLTLSESGKLLKERLDAIMNNRNTVKMSSATSLLLALLLTAGAITAGASTDPRGTAAPDSPADPNAPAMNLPMGNVPVVIKGDADTAFRYTQEVYNQSPWFFELCWNVNEKAGGYYPSRIVPLSSGDEITVYYDEICSNVMENPEALDALATLLESLQKESKDTEYPLKRALLLSVRRIDTHSSYSELAEQAYQEGSISTFSTTFASLSEDEQRAYLNRCYDDGHISLFAAAVFRLPKSSPLINEFAQKSYEDQYISFFSVLVNGYMDPKTAETWLNRAEQDHRASFCSVLYKALGRDEELEAMEAELDRQLAEEYRAHGITIDGKNYYYQGQLVHIFMDKQPNKSFYRLDMNPLGTINIKLLRGEDGQIQGVDYMTEAEVTELFGDNKQ
jgi:beta-lactamase regulating signal transducer with metallopeptidase domain